eukprot:TRINITY_DN26020_c0_g1_i1.p1 TRINITY_DN26020_c0_g1~~TRINITY_DN26020_c0_g1_i1.p1  ORF type:complete len:556 (-),score=98.03 TRINITY_DN26020_c0_g1_i1:107-1774(-)
MGAAKSRSQLDLRSRSSLDFPTDAPCCRSSDNLSHPSSSSRACVATESDEARMAEYRIRFYLYNMANNSNFSSIDELQGPAGKGSFRDSLQSAFADGKVMDLCFATLVETRLSMTDWVLEYMSKNRDFRLDSMIPLNARREGSRNTRSRMRSIAEGLAASYNGNLKSVLAWCSDEFKEDKEGEVFGRLTERTIGGVPLPNPKKAFMGRSLIAQQGEGIRLCFVGAHFPIQKMAAALEDSADPLYGAKIALAKTLRRILQKASRRNLADERTIIFVQGDLNSRTVLQGEEVHDALLELLRDDEMQAAIQHQFDLPPGRFRELVTVRSVHDLPVTYKFLENQVCKATDGSTADARSFTIGDVIGIARQRDTFAEAPTDAANSPKSPSSSFARRRCFTDSGLYKRTMDTLGTEQLDTWGVVFKQNAFRAFRFPACADRVIYWAPDALSDRISWEFPCGGYEVNHGQLGSDHRPVSVEAIMRIAPVPLTESKKLSPARTFMVEGILQSDEEHSEAEDDEDLSEGIKQALSPSAEAFRAGALMGQRQDTNEFVEYCCESI